MAGFSIGLNAIRAMTRLIDMSADNIANADTPGYHVKRATVAPVVGPTVGGVRVGLGSQVLDVERVVNDLIESALLDHTQSREFLAIQSETLAHMEMVFGEPSEAGLDARLGEFFDSVEQLTARPDDPTLREQVVQKALMVTDMFNQLDAQLTAIHHNLGNSVAGAVEEVNGLTERIASLNTRIRTIETSGASAPGLKDTRDQLIAELAELVNVRVQKVENGMVNVSSAGTMLVHEGRAATLVDTETPDGEIVVTFEEAAGHRLRITAGKLGGLLELANDVLPTHREALDDLADSFRRAVNSVHTTGLGLGGRFERLEGLHAFPDDTPFHETGYGVRAGTEERLVINVEDTATGEVNQFELELDTTLPADEFLLSLQDEINESVDHLTASIDRERISLRADDGFAFGFATPYDPNPAGVGSPVQPGILGAYSGEQDLRYEVTFGGTGEIGSDAIEIEVEVTEPDGTSLGTFDRLIDEGYRPGDVINLENGLKLTLQEGAVTIGESFDFMAYGQTDTAGVLDALGLNVLFTGRGAGDIAVAEPVRQDPSRLAGSLRPMAGDNRRLLELSRVREQNVAGGGTSTLQGAYHALLGGLSTAKNTREVQLENQEQLLKDLHNRRDAVSGVSIDEEMMRIMSAQTIYRGALKYITMVDNMLADLAAL